MKKAHSKLSSSRNGYTHELQNVPAQDLRPVNNMSHDLAYGWQNENGSQINIVPTNRILEVKEMDVKSEEWDNHEWGKDEECGWNGSRAAASARTVF